MLKIINGLALIAHGIGHIMGFMASWTTVPMGFSHDPWVLSSNVTLESVIGRIFGLVWLVAMLGSMIAGYGLLSGQAWWRTLAIVSAVVSLAVIVPWWNTVNVGPKWGALFDVAVLVVLLTPLSEQLTQAMG